MTVAAIARRVGATLGRVAIAIACVGSGAAFAQAPVNTTPSRQILEDAARSGCDGASVVVRRCVDPTVDPAKTVDDPLAKSRAAAKAAFDRRDRQARDAALRGDPPAASGGAERLETVTVTGRASESAPSVEDVLQRALNPPAAVVSPAGTVTQYGIDGARTECIAKCYGPMCCTTVRALPNPARDSNAIGR